jgi:hypothetical protein
VVTVFSFFGTFTDYLLKAIESTGIYHKIEKSCVAAVVYCLPFDHSATIARGFFHLEKIEVGLQFDSHLFGRQSIHRSIA